MCSAPDIPAPQQVPERQAARMPDNGDPGIRASDRKRRMLTVAASILTGGRLGIPSVAAPGGAVGVAPKTVLGG